MKNLAYFFVLLSFVLCSCSSSNVYQSYSPNGKPSYEISCSNLAGSLSKCYQKAGEICLSKGFNVISKHEGSFATVIVECKN